MHRGILSRFATTFFLGALTSGAFAASSKDIAAVNSIASAAELSGRLAGAAIVGEPIFTDDVDPQYTPILTAEYNFVTPENAGKWGEIQTGEIGAWDFTQHDPLVDFAANNSMKYKGHALVWHSQAPAFITDDLTAGELQALIDDHIITTMSRYAGEIYSWDVVNEAISDDGGYRDTVFYRKLGPDFIADAFFLARSIDNKAKLFYNDYYVAEFESKSDEVYEMLKGLREDEVPVDGIGMQMHIAASSAPSYEKLVANFKRFAELGLLINISELDIRVANLPWDQATKLAVQKQVYHRVVAACMAVNKCEAVTTWGFNDKWSWVDGFFGNDDPLPFDDDYQKKPAYFGIVDAFMGIEPDAVDVNPNMIPNGHMSAGIDGWMAWGGTLERDHINGSKGGNILRVTDRTDTWNGAVHDLTNVLKPGQAYDVAAMTRVGKEAKKDITEINAKYRCAGEGDTYVNLAADETRFNKWSELQGELALPECDLEEVVVYISGPAAGNDLLVDNVSVRPQKMIVDFEGYGPNIIGNSDFEVDASGWWGFGDAQVEVTAEKAKIGLQCLVGFGRLDTWQGPATGLAEIAVPGSTYKMSAWVSVSSLATVNATVKAACVDSEDYIRIASNEISPDGWTLLAGEFEVPDCELTELSLYFEGPSTEVDIYLDDVNVRRFLPPSNGNLVTNSGFESNLSGWVSWGGQLELSAFESYSGNQSAYLYQRTGSWEGPVYNLLSVAQPAATYEISAWGKIEGAASDSMNITVKAACDDETEDYLWGGQATVTDTGWAQIAGSVTLPDCALTEVSMYFGGPAQDVNIFLDEVSVLLAE